MSSQTDSHQILFNFSRVKDVQRKLKSMMGLSKIVGEQLVRIMGNGQWRQGTVWLKDFFVLNRVRVSNPQRLTYTQRLFEYPSDRALDAVHFTHERVNI